MRIHIAAWCVGLAVVWPAASCSRGDALDKRLASPDPAVRSDAAIKLGESKSQLAVAKLVPMLADREESVRVDVIRALGDIGDPKVVPAILPCFDDSSAVVRMAACQAAAKLGDPRAVPALEKVLYDPDPSLRTVAARSLGMIPGPESLDVLLRVALQDESETIRSHVVRVVGDRRAREAVPKLESALGAESDRVRANAIIALGEIGDISSLPLLTRGLADPYYKVRCLSAHAIAKVAPKDMGARESLAKRLAVETNGMAKVDLAWALGTMGDASQLGIVRALLFEGDPEDVRAEAALALGAVGGTSDLPILDRAMTDKKGLVRNRAAEAIDRIKGARSS